MPIFVISTLLCLLSELSYITHYLLYVFSIVLLIISGGWHRVIILLYFVTLVYDMIKLAAMRLIWNLYSALLSAP